MTKRLFTPDHHTQMWSCCNKVESTKLYRMYLYATALQFLLTGTEHVPGRYCHCAQSEGHEEDIVFQYWSGRW